jgi:hypothetical protein
MGMRNSPSPTPVAEEVIELCRLLALFGSAVMSDLSPEMRTKADIRRPL